MAMPNGTPTPPDAHSFHKDLMIALATNQVHAAAAIDPLDHSITGHCCSITEIIYAGDSDSQTNWIICILAHDHEAYCTNHSLDLPPQYRECCLAAARTVSSPGSTIIMSGLAWPG
jgi:hypothetical protein